MPKYNFQIDDAGQILGHTDPPYSDLQEGGVMIEPPADYAGDDVNWQIIDGQMTKKELVPIEPAEPSGPSESQQLITGLSMQLAETQAQNETLKNNVSELKNMFTALSIEVAGGE